MKFHRIVGKIDKILVEKAQAKLSQVFLELGIRATNEYVGSGMGGDPLIFSLMFPVQHIATMNIPTAATDGKRFFWNPKFVESKSITGLRIVCGHEAWHAIYMHPQRRGTRHPKLWNIAVDFIVNGTVMEDLKKRKLDPHTYFTKHLGNYATLEQTIALFKDPFSDIPGFEKFVPEPEDELDPVVALPKPDEDRELTDDEKKELAKREKKVKFFYADANIAEEMKRPEKIYDLLYSVIPKCPKCGRLGIYQPPKDKKNSKNAKNAKKQNSKTEQNKQQSAGGKSNQQKDDSDNHSDQSNDHDHSHGDDDENTCGCPSDQSGNQPGGNQQGCGECGGGYDIFQFGDTLDDHMDSEETQEKMAKRITDAIEAAKQMAGHVPAALEDELGLLTSPKIKWQDFIRTRLSKARAGNAKNDWTKFRSRPMFAGLMIPKRTNNFATFAALLDTSGSMSKEDMAFGVSQLASLDERSEGWIIPADAEIYWKDATKIRKAKADELSRVKVIGRGGTKYAEFFTDYEKHLGKVDFLIIITDGFLLDQDVAEMKNPSSVDVIWLITSGSAFNAPFGRVFDLRSS